MEIPQKKRSASDKGILGCMGCKGCKHIHYMYIIFRLIKINNTYNYGIKKASGNSGIKQFLPPI